MDIEVPGPRLFLSLQAARLAVALAPMVYPAARTEAFLRSIGHLARLRLGLAVPEPTVWEGPPAGLAWRLPATPAAEAAQLSRLLRELARRVNAGEEPFLALGAAEQLAAEPAADALAADALAADALAADAPAAVVAAPAAAPVAATPAEQPADRQQELQRAAALGLPPPPEWPAALGPAPEPPGGVLEDLRGGRGEEALRDGRLARLDVGPRGRQLPAEPAELDPRQPVDLLLDSPGPFPTKLQGVLSILLSIDYPRAGQVLRALPTVLLRKATLEHAQRYRQVLEQAGGRVRIVPS